MENFARRVTNNCSTATLNPVLKKGDPGMVALIGINQNRGRLITDDGRGKKRENLRKNIGGKYFEIYEEIQKNSKIYNL